MTHALFSVKPKWSDLILSGRKTVELRRMTPKLLKPGSVIVLYETSPTCAIVGEAEVESVRRLVIATDLPRVITNARTRDHACVSRCDVQVLLGCARSPCAIWLCEARRYPRTILLRDGAFLLPGYVRASKPPRSFAYLHYGALEAIRREAGWEEGDD